MTENEASVHPQAQDNCAYSERQRHYWYYGVSANPPILVYTTSTEPFVPDAQPSRYPEPVYDHTIVKQWQKVVLEAEKLLDDQRLLWTSIDLVRFHTRANKESNHVDSVGPPTFWIGVLPGRVSGAAAAAAAVGIRRILVAHAVEGVDIEFREPKQTTPGVA
ncbi:hypothetical protein BD626DRAFT_633136 [Schizophyllum amplum]|uniref:Uncharacterized protein n=1 Tax=Schizophyllum amplum TaxID=97359 RepID=A0A550C4H1_9AGAR|nr:hypothetical protein BD626DRAFT_633136 [Auriculariopsis ampla]